MVNIVAIIMTGHREAFAVFRVMSLVQMEKSDSWGATKTEQANVDQREYFCFIFYF